jgi:hypothetical protein
MMPEQIARETVAVPFAGQEAGSAPMTWGQRALWRDLQATGLSMSLVEVVEQPEGTSVADLTAQLGSLASRHPALRTRLSTDADGSPCQVVSASGELALDVVSVDGDGDQAARYARGVEYEQLVAPLDLLREWPVRLTVVRQRDTVRHAVYTFSHLIADATALALLLAEIESGSVPDGAPALHSLELARREQTETWQRVSDRAVSYWETQLGSVPPVAFGEPTHPEGWRDHRYWYGQFNSPATHLAVLAIAERTGTDGSRVLHALIATAIARITGVSPLTVKVVTSNRFRPGFATAIAKLSQDGLLTVDLADATIDEAVARVRRGLLAAIKYAYYDPGQVEDMTARLRAENGWPGRITFKINDSRAPATKRAIAPVTPEQIRRKLPETSLSWDGIMQKFPEEAWITVLDLPETVCLQVNFDFGCVPREQAEALLREVEQVAVEAAFDPQAPTRVTRVS